MNRFIAFLVFVGLTPCLGAWPHQRTVPDAGLIAAIDDQAESIVEGVTTGDFEGYYPEIYSDFAWSRQTQEIWSGGLLRLDYDVYSKAAARGRGKRYPESHLSILLFRPGMLDPASPSSGEDPTQGRLRGFHHRCDGQRSREILIVLESIVAGVQMYSSNPDLYAFTGTDRELTLVSKLPVPLFGPSDLPQRIRLHLGPGSHRRDDLTLEFGPLLPTHPLQRMLLARDVTLFDIQYFEGTNRMWQPTWHSTNNLPSMVQITIGVGHLRGRDRLPVDLASRIISLPAIPVPTSISRPARPLTNNIMRSALEASPSAPMARCAELCSREIDFHWLGRSGMELAKYALSQRSGPAGQVDALNQRWAGASGGTNDPLRHLPLENFPLGDATLSVTIEDYDRKFNINVADDIILRQAMIVIGADTYRSAVIVDSILDWRDMDNDARVNGDETVVKNGPIDHIAELLGVRGITPELYGSLRQLFTAHSSKAININTTTATVLQILPGIDENSAHRIITGRSGPDGVDGTSDDMPYRSPQDIARIGILPPEMLQSISRYFTVRSLIFEVRVQVRLGEETRNYAGLLRRDSPSAVHLLHMAED